MGELTLMQKKQKELMDERVPLNTFAKMNSRLSRDETTSKRVELLLDQLKTMWEKVEVVFAQQEVQRALLQQLLDSTFLDQTFDANKKGENVSAGGTELSI